MEKMDARLPKRKHLKRIPVWLPADQPVVYLVTLCCIERRRVFVNAETVRVGVECLARTAARHAWHVGHVCFMPDHVHLLASPLQSREQALSVFIQAWKSCVTLRLKSDSIWQREFHDRLLRHDEKVEEEWQYIRENPARAGLCSRPENYPYTDTPAEILERLNGANKEL